MVFCSLVMLHGAGRAALKCTTQPHVGTRIGCTLYDLPAGGRLLVGDGENLQHTHLAEKRTEWRLPPLEAEALWGAYLDQSGKVLAKGSADGVWRDYMTQAVHAFLAQSMAERESSAQEGTTQEPDGEEGQTQPDVRQNATPDDAAASLASCGQDTEITDSPLRHIVSIATDDLLDLPLPTQVADSPSPEATERDANGAEDTDGTPLQTTAQEAGTNAPVGTEEATPTLQPVGEETTDSAPLNDADIEGVLQFMQDYPSYQPLCRLIEGSRWVLVQEGDSAYLLGLLYDSTPAPTHLCYGVIGTRNRPFRPDAEWLDDPEGKDGDGYWIVYNECAV